MSVATIKNAIISAIAGNDPSLDTAKGPIYDILIQPVPEEINTVSEQVASLRTLYSPLAATDPSNESAIDILGSAFRVSKSTGRAATTQLVFWFKSSPSQDIVIPAGTSVATTDRAIVYSTLSDVRVRMIAVAGLWNTATNRYEIRVDAQASGVGTQYEVPANRLTLLMSSPTGIQGVYNVTPGVDGIDPGTYDSYLTRIQSRLVARDLSSFAETRTRIQDMFPEVVFDIMPHTSPAFTRPVRGDALDVLVASRSTRTRTDNFYGTQSVFVVEKQPLVSVVSVSVNGIETNNYKTNIGAGTARDSGSVEVSGVNSTDTVSISYMYDYYVNSIQDQCFNSTSDDWFNTDALVRQAQRYPLYVTLVVSTTTQVSGIQDSVRNTVLTYLSSLGFVTVLRRSEIVDLVTSDYPEVVSLSFKVFGVVPDSCLETITIPQGSVFGHDAGQVIVNLA